MAPLVGGGGSGAVHSCSDASIVVTPLQGITQRAGSDFDVIYDDGTDVVKASALAAASSTELVVLVVGTTSGEGTDRPSLQLPQEQDALVTAVASASKKAGAKGAGVVVVCMSPGAVLLPWASQIDALLLMLMPGAEVGHALADLLWGDVSPVGRLPLTVSAMKRTSTCTSDLYSILYSSVHLWYFIISLCITVCIRCAPF
jgi:beta-glucosidase